MKEASWNDCISSSASRKITPDKEKAKSLIETAEGRIEASREINEKTANYVFEDYYSSVLEFLHAIVLLEGYNVSNHVCLGYYLRDVLKEEHLFRIFDDCRYKRNSLVYYGKRMDFETAKDAIKKAQKMITEFKKIIKT
ncbi:MAG TPA: hypothetical protein VJK72_03350 [Candidatus Nanoarchaeia archaeon]|nr:hypothetical protein [Candidatus Nanoarchaeia archaeon]